MGGLLILFAGAFVPLAVIAYGLRIASLRFFGDDILAGLPMGIAMLIAGRVAGASFVRQAGRTASMGYSLAFGLIAAALILAGVLAIWLWGWPLPGLPKIGPGGAEPWILPRALTTLLLIGGICAFAIPFCFKGGADAADRKRRAGLAPAGE